VRTTRGERFLCDAVVLTCELTTAYRLLGDVARPVVAAPSAVVVHLGMSGDPGGAAHHTLLFGRAWRTTFSELTRDGRLMRDPSLLVTRPTATDPALAPHGRQLVSVLAPVPNLARSALDWDRIGASYAAELGDLLAERSSRPPTGAARG
jgi:phytoene desaturase